MKINHIYVGDNVETLKTLPDESVDMCITSPPYYNLRDYNNEDQLGSESTVTDYVNNLIEVFSEIYRVMKPTGSCWVNIADSYSDKKLLQVPSRFEIAMTDAGWSLRNEIIWNKPNPQPISSKDRFWSNQEKLFWFVKKTKGYYFDREKIQVPQSESALRRLFRGNHPEKRKDAGTTRKEGYSLSAERQVKYFAKMIKSMDIEKGFNYEELVASGKCPTRPMFSVWDISTKNFKGSHFAVYPPDLIERPILSTCPPNGIVIDPFMGSGTTAVVAKNNDRKYIGCELNPEYAELAEKRISKSVVSSLKTFFKEGSI